MTPPRTSPLLRLLAYYLLLAGAVWALVTLFPQVPELLERFRQATALAASKTRGLEAAPSGLEQFSQLELALITLLTMLAALALVVPVAWVYMITKQRRGYDQSVVQTVIILPMTVAGTIVLVQNSLSLAFALGAVVAIVRFRNTLKDTKDTVYIFLALGVGVASGVFSPSVAAVMSLLYNLTVLFLWRYNIGNIYADQLGRTAPLRPGEALLGPGKTGEFLAVGDPRLLAALTPDQLDEVADRAARLQAYIAARSGDDKKKRFTAVVLVHTKDPKAAQLVVEPILEDRTKRWRLAEILPEEGGASTLEYLVRLKDDVEASTFLDVLQHRGAPSVVAAEYRSLLWFEARGVRSADRWGASISLVCGLAVSPAGLVGQGADSLHPPGHVHVAAGARYRAGLLHRWLLGSHYRDVWEAPITVDILDVATFAGGLRPTMCAGRRQTKSIRLQGGDGRTYVFRSVDKDPTLALPPNLQQTFARDILQDQTSSAHPGAPLVVAPLLEATGVLHATPSLYVLPDDPRLSAFDCVYAGMLGMIEVRPTASTEEEPGFAGAADIASTEKLFGKLEESSTNRVDERAFLVARLLDVYLGDWDRHQDQWRWARFDEGRLHWWRPIPRDRDQAFSRMDGLLVRLAGMYYPEIVGFGDAYPSLFRLTLTGQVLDRRLLVGLERSVWDSTATALQAQLTDSVIDQAVGRLPQEYRGGSGAGLKEALRQRRMHLPEAAGRFYRLLAEYVDIHATDESDSGDVDRQPDRTIVRLVSKGHIYFSRTFDPRDTKEIRLYLHGADDRVVVRGSGSGPLIRLIGGGGNDELFDSSSGGAVRFYDDRGTNHVVRGRHTRVDAHSYEYPPIDTNTLGRPRDWGTRAVPFTWVSYGSDIGLFVGGGIQHTGYGFRELPYHTRTVLRAGYATGAASGRADLVHEIRDFPRHATTTLHVRASGIDVVRFYGFGNTTRDTGSTAFHKVPQQQYLISPSITWGLTPTRVSVGLVAKDAETTTDSSRLIGIVRPYGTGSFQQVGATTAFQVDTRDRPAWATRGVLFSIAGAAYPALLDVKQGFGTLSAQAATYLTVPHGPTLALRIAGSRVFGTYPFYEAAFIGGATTVRGFPDHRFAGDAALLANAELRASLGHFYFLVPIEFGGFGLADAGRVFLSGEQSDVWHGAAGGGLWFSFLSRTNTLVVAAARSPERTGIYVRAGFSY